eukprot:14806579-Ditylum_brightwellii.AAC.1
MSGQPHDQIGIKNIIKIMLDEVPPRWLLAEIEDRETRLNTVSIHNILDHAFDCKGQIDDDLVDEYAYIYNSPIDISKGFNMYVERQEDCRDFFEDAEQPITNTQLAAKSQLHVGQTGFFKEKHITWKCRAITMKT